MALVRFSLLIGLMMASLLGPGLLLTRRLHLPGLERLTLSIGLSGIVLYLLSFGIYALDLAQSLELAVIAASVIMFGVSIRDFSDSLQDQATRFSCQVFLFLAFWVGLHLCLVRSFSGGGWSGDWLEHYQRTLFFALRLPLDFRFLEQYWLPARPPMVNVLTSHFISSLGSDFPLYQLATAIMGVLVCFPLLLFAQHAHEQPRKFLPLFLFLLALNPMFLQNSVYSWTRNPTNFYVLSGVYFYWRGDREENATKIAFSFLLLAAAILCHYSAGPYVAAIAGHFLLRSGLFRVLRQRFLLVLTLAAGLLLASWFAWSLTQFGAATTFGSNTTVLKAEYSWTAFARKFLFNSWSTIVPYWFRSVNLGVMQQASVLGRVRDSVFLFVQTNLIGAVGVTGGLLLIAQTVLELCRGCFRNGPWLFWAAMALSAGLLSIAVNDHPDQFGIAHVCLQPFVLLALVRLAALAPIRGVIFRSFLGAGTIAGYALGVLLHFFLQSMSFAGDQQLLGKMSFTSRVNWELKEKFSVVFVGDLVADYQKFLLAAEILTALWLGIMFVRAARSMKPPSSPALQQHIRPTPSLSIAR